MKKRVPIDEFLPENRIDTTNAFLDRYWPKLGRKIAPEWLLFINKCSFPIFVINFRDFFVHQIESHFPVQRHYSWSRALRVTCMRAVNRQPMFTARGTRRAFSVSVHASCSITHVSHWNTDSWMTTIEQLNHRKRRHQAWKNVEFFTIFFSTSGYQNISLYTLNHSRPLPTHARSFLDAS